MSEASRRAQCIGFDATRALRNVTGLGNYARGVLRGLHAAEPKLEMHLYSPRPARPEFVALPNSVGGTLHLPPKLLARPVARAYWRTFRLGKAVMREQIELYHGLTQEIPRDLPRTGVPSVVTIADLLFHTHPELFPAIDRRSYLWRYRWSAEHAQAVVAISDWTRQQLHREFGIALERIAVIPPARDPRFTSETSARDRARTLEKYQIPAQFLVAVGTLEPRKNQGVAIAAMATAHPSVPPLVLIGRDGGSEAALRNEIQKLGLEKRVLIRRVDHDDLPAVVQSARAALYLSLAEGFGMPIVEALSAGVPVIVAAGDHLRDAGGSTAYYVNPTDPNALADVIEMLLKDGVADTIRELGRRHAATFDAAPLAQRLLRVYDAVLAGKPVNVASTARVVGHIAPSPEEPGA